MNSSDTKNMRAERKRYIRKKFLTSPKDELSDELFLEYILTFVVTSADTKVVAENLLKYFGSFSTVLEANFIDLKKVEGVSLHTATFIASLLPIYKRYLERKVPRTFKYNDHEKLSIFIKSKYINENREIAILVFFDKRGNYIGCSVVGTGDTASVEINNRTVALEAMRHENARGAILVHNHPSGIANPSADDIVTTNNAKNFLSSISVRLYDSVIFASNQLFFFSQSKYFALE